MSVIRISSPGLPVRGRCVVTSSPGTSTRVVIPGRCSVPCVRVAVLTNPGGHRRPLSPHGAGDYDRERGPRVPSRLTPRRGARVPVRLSCCRNPWSVQDVRPRGLLITVIVIVLIVPPS